MSREQYSLDRPSPLAQLSLWLLLSVLIVVVVGFGWKQTQPQSNLPQELPDHLRAKASEAWQLLGADKATRAGELTDDGARLATADQLIAELEQEAPRVPTVHFYRGLHGLAVDRPEQAAIALQRAAKLDAEHLAVWLTLSAVYTELRDYKAAEAALLQVLERDPVNLSALENLGQVLWLLGRKEESKAVYRRQLTLEGKPLVPEGPV